MRKETLEQLALFGSPPSFAEEIPVGQVNLPPWDEFKAAFNGIFARGHYTNHGPLVAELEEAVKNALGVRHAICVTNGTIALAIAARALRLGGQVIVPAFTFPGTVQALSWAGLEPVFADVDAHTHGLTAASVAPHIGPQTSAVLGVHLWGTACDPSGLAALCDAHGLQLFYDAAHAFGCSHAGQFIGGLGRIEAFSFHATKIISGAEGGCLTTNDDEIAARARTIRNFHQAHSFADVGLRINGKMSEAQAAMALLSLRHFDAHRDHNRRIFMRYRERAAVWRGVRLYDYPNGEAHNYQYAVLEVDSAAGLSRDDLLDLLRAENVLARRYFHPGVHHLSPYAEQARPPLLPVTDALCRSSLQIPLGPRVDEGIAEVICGLIDLALAHADEIGRRLQARREGVPG
ncbi:DegT/DnrJ/EryC1/StrS family aminotransferase [Thauera mechernichensis]|uniref:DegT/DnrJ/EryC1/StrS family aminotransferase n=1 Tax=Thauera mechernichensis TaxID=82788 RepID=A0ABW3WDY1_9RHOO|nr:aminotransferase class I/II-fold pyridoxal phosphate-dependent enzyme [Thauera mechernichensis]MDG3064001.1 aminotransferase class I/II-fold pyridoxal phosphate-dependent enzyme [Thauera mechernichensis]